MSNFQFLQAEFPALFPAARQVEMHVLGDARAACFYGRFALETTLDWMFAADQSLGSAYDSLNDNLHELKRQGVLPPVVWEKARLIQRLGNGAVHGGLAPTLLESKAVARDLWHLMFWVARTYGAQKPADALQWDERLLPPAPANAIAQSRAQVQELARQLEAQRETLGRSLERSEAEVARLQQEVERAKAAALQTPDAHNYSEKETRDAFIDVMLREAGWPLNQKRDREFEVQGMPNAGGIGFVDYVLWGDDGRPLAVVEAKKTRASASVGQQQAKLYADCLEAKYGRRPIIFYTNGYETYGWDDTRYPPRAVQGFFKKDELERLISARQNAQNLSQMTLDETIVERAYQTRAIRKYGEALDARYRKGLFVMATGTGKTRTAIALVDALMRAGWVKRTLFLADRTALVNQTVREFKKHLPGSSPVNLVTDKSSSGASVFVSTYPTMMGLIDQIGEDGARRFGAGHFDLVIIDEAHRGVYQKFGAIFGYFDSLLLGLTATPRDEVDRDTYGLFNLKSGEPTDVYELKAAIEDHFLVKPELHRCDLKFPVEGIKYDQLSDAEKEQWDAQEWGDEGTPEEVAPHAVNSWLFNTDTVDKVLAHLMTHGLRVAGGDRLGKTIIFARNHKHAEFIVERFNENYPSLAGHFCRVIDTQVKYPQTLIDDFGQEKNAPHIAVSVDMLDTGIDVPEIVNLVLFKPVRSKTKFWQMLGRGTRLRPDLFGPGLDKEKFCAFDFCGNFEFFNIKPDGVQGSAPKTLSQRLFEHRLTLLESARGEENAALRRDWADELHAQVAGMNPQNFVVRPHLRQVEKWSERAEWEKIGAPEREEILEHLSDLPSELPTDSPEARQFDDLMLRLQLAHLNVERAFGRLQKEVRALAENLLEKTTIPFVKAQEAFLMEVSSDEWWEGVTLGMLEEARRKMRDLVQFADKNYRPNVQTNVEDSDVLDEEVEIPGLQDVLLVSYEKKIRAFIDGQKRHHPVIIKLRQNEGLTHDDLQELDRLLFEASGFESREEFEKYFGPQPKLGEFVRSLVGLDREAAKAAFGPFLHGSNYSSAQIDFINQVIDYLAQKGTIKTGQLYRSPITSHPDGVEGVFPAHYEELLKIVRGINANATPRIV